jgi:hypothetical protein
MSSKKVNIVDNANEVRITNSNNKIEIVDTNVPSNIEVTQPVTTIVQINSAGPKGDRGLPGEGLPGPPGPGSIFEKINDILYFTTSSLQITGSVDIQSELTTSLFLISNPSPTSNLFNINVAGDDKVKVNSEGTFIIKESTITPTGETGGLLVSGSNFFIFL